MALGNSTARGSESGGESGTDCDESQWRMAAGVQTGTVRFAFDDGSATTIQVVVLYSQRLACGNRHRPLDEATPVALQELTACPVEARASFLIPVFQQPVVIPGSTGRQLPETLLPGQEEIIDDCGNPVSSRSDGEFGSGYIQQHRRRGRGGAVRLARCGVRDHRRATWAPVNVSESQV